MLKKIHRWFRIKSVKREVVRNCERDAIKQDFEAELNKQPAGDLTKGIHEIELHIKDLIHEAEELESHADLIAADETMDPKGRYDKAQELRQQAREKRGDIPNQEKLISDYRDAILKFKSASSQRMSTASALRIKAEFVRRNY